MILRRQIIIPTTEAIIDRLLWRREVNIIVIIIIRGFERGVGIMALPVQSF